MCAKYQRRCAVLLQIREEALIEWAKAETLHDVRVAWGRLGGRTLLHRRGPGYFMGRSSQATGLRPLLVLDTINEPR
jgi:hypothetical protein